MPDTSADNRCYPSDFADAAPSADGVGNGFYLPVGERDYDDDDRHRAYDASFPEPEGADRW